ncbi:lipopolysaccharide kinase InaA family protein [Autumnicola psychrophila]|uniref:Lipopolysaccharide kinase InaA family protein n=1 Tax=Autumnicola psychrophila TaxID=3075592 RepID=A0ABU3DUF4_9FLAO|nr:lipopolysaccharide kinase InaA family protein [Zunongwangia sp. F225]MDT0687089.1 lipopolysaccharide kinase InaA family protein [Zunongwangia sp. F225]
MKFVVEKAFADQREEILHFVNHFSREGEVLDKGQRNDIKIFDLNGKKLNVKSFKKPNLINQVAYKYFRKSKARRSFENANYLLSHNLKTPVPVAYAEAPGLLFTESFYVCEQIPYDLTFRELIHEPDYPQREEILRAFTQFTFRLHENNVNFLDHSPGNTLIQTNNGNFEFYLVDLNRMKFEPLNFEERMKNLHRITRFEDMAKIIANEYAKLIPETEEEVFSELWSHIQKFQEKARKKKEFKKRLGLKK